MPKETRVRWNPAEKAALIAEAKRAIAARPMRYMDALQLAQQHLPENRRRHVVGAWDVPWFVQGLGAAGATAHASARGTGAGKAVAGIAESPLGEFREALVRFFTDVLAEAFARAQGQGRGSGGANARAARGTVKRAQGSGRAKPGRRTGRKGRRAGQ
jgi:hypothetical protein